MNIALLIPTYNEAENIRTLLPEVAAILKKNSGVSLCVYVIDDNSPDGTQQEAESIAQTINGDNFCVRTVARTHKEGLGKAYVHGFRHVLEAGNFDYVIQMDADLSHSPVYLSSFFNLANQGIDLVVASRYVEGGAVPDWSWHRKLLSKLGNLYARTLLGSTISDYTGGFNMFSTRLLQQIDFERLNSPGYGFLITLKYEALTKSRSVVQVPIVFVDRKSGESKMPLSTLANNFKLVFDLWRKK